MTVYQRYGVITEMRRILFILNYRAGTNLWNFVSGRRLVYFHAPIHGEERKKTVPLINPEIPEPGYAFHSNGWQGSDHSHFLATIPSKICPCETYFARGIEESLATDPPFHYFSWHTHIGDWWGEARSNEVPEPYEVETPVRFGPDELLALPGDDWRFIYVVRDGRNQIESLRWLPGGVEEERRNRDPWDNFLVLCKAFRNRARLALDCRDRLSDFKLVYFEDLTRNCVETMEDIYDFAGLQIDKGFTQRAFDLTLGFRNRHSSFGASEGANARWQRWNSKEIRAFKEIAGKELVELGYEKDNDW